MTVLLAGVAMLALPGPGMVVIIVGLVILATEFAWAQRLLDIAVEKVAAANSRAQESRHGKRMLAASGHRPDRGRRRRDRRLVAVRRRRDLADHRRRHRAVHPASHGSTSGSTSVRRPASTRPTTCRLAEPVGAWPSVVLERHGVRRDVHLRLVLGDFDGSSQAGELRDQVDRDTSGTARSTRRRRWTGSAGTRTPRSRRYSAYDRNRCPIAARRRPQPATTIPRRLAVRPPTDRAGRHRRRPDDWDEPNYFVRRALVVGVVVAAIAGAAVLASQFIGGDDSSTPSTSAAAEWDTIVVLSCRRDPAPRPRLDRRDRHLHRVRRSARRPVPRRRQRPRDDDRRRSHHPDRSRRRVGTAEPIRTRRDAADHAGPSRRSRCPGPTPEATSRSSTPATVRRSASPTSPGSTTR